MTVTVRQARQGDHDDVAAFTGDTWPDREMDDYLPEVFSSWVSADGPRQRTVVGERDGTVVGLCQAKLLTETEGWLQGIRVSPAARGVGVGTAMVEALFEWCRERGAAVARNMVFEWNDAGLGQSRAVGFSPSASFRTASPEPNAGATAALPVGEDPDVAWHFWTDSDDRTGAAGLALAPDESWAHAELTRDRLHRLAEDGRVVTVGGDRTRAMTARRPVGDPPDEDDRDHVAEYVIGAWADATAAEALFHAIAADAAAVGVDATRVWLPDTVRHLSDAARVGARPDETSAVINRIDLTGR